MPLLENISDAVAIIRDLLIIILLLGTMLGLMMGMTLLTQLSALLGKV